MMKRHTSTFFLLLLHFFPVSPPLHSLDILEPGGEPLPFRVDSIKGVINERGANYQFRVQINPQSNEKSTDSGNGKKSGRIESTETRGGQSIHLKFGVNSTHRFYSTELDLKSLLPPHGFVSSTLTALIRLQPTSGYESIWCPNHPEATLFFDTPQRGFIRTTIASHSPPLVICWSPGGLKSAEMAFGATAQPLEDLGSIKDLERKQEESKSLAFAREGEKRKSSSNHPTPGAPAPIATDKRAESKELDALSEKLQFTPPPASELQNSFAASAPNSGGMGSKPQAEPHAAIEERQDELTEGGAPPVEPIWPTTSEVARERDFDTFYEKIHALENTIRRLDNTLAFVRSKPGSPDPYLLHLSTVPNRLKGNHPAIVLTDFFVPEKTELNFSAEIEGVVGIETRESAAKFVAPPVPGPYPVTLRFKDRESIRREWSFILDVFQNEDIRYSGYYYSNKIAAIKGRIFRLEREINRVQEELRVLLPHSAAAIPPFTGDSLPLLSERGTGWILSCPLESEKLFLLDPDGHDRVLTRNSDGVFEFEPLSQTDLLAFRAMIPGGGSLHFSRARGR